MKKYALEYSGYKFDYFSNLGDEIQTLAAVRLLNGVDGYIGREALNAWNGLGLVSLNGFFMGSGNWPPSPGLAPVFFSFHINKAYESVICSPAGLDYLRRHEPIGCRDRGTLSILEKHGIKAFYSRCVTLTLPPREPSPEAREVFIVGVDKELEQVIPRALRKEAVKINQSSVRLPLLSCELKREMAQQLLDGYARRAKLVITSKIHCAMPCIAMGIPVVFLYPKEKLNDYRVHLVGDILPINYVPRSSLIRRLGLQKLLTKKIDWSPQAVNIEAIKEEVARGYAEAVARALQAAGHSTVSSQ
ncbi:polysaccharide pyruvyl transferase family protein [Pseudomonas sp. UL073]|uniref:Polysaccharide pyruvyl transferase family protein n=1 Tax=Zestomonas insulae TaxID=2809017 RepID=A0ABS2IDL1_9GAMM|nr:polysaccharide pyruvyl transferase family protein [Pseudomonas insulae]MBM7061186.1 polysaccharide pyruvyl transferase family protein [Pseudomonas insulae]